MLVEGKALALLYGKRETSLAETGINRVSYCDFTCVKASRLEQGVPRFAQRNASSA